VIDEINFKFGRYIALITIPNEVLECCVEGVHTKGGHGETVLVS
jgi:hypothetical protein